MDRAMCLVKSIIVFGQLAQSHPHCLNPGVLVVCYGADAQLGRFLQLNDTL